MINSLLLRTYLGSYRYSTRVLCCNKISRSFKRDFHSFTSLAMSENGFLKIGLRSASHYSAERSNLLFKFGVICDVQYADVDDRLNYEGTVMRYYRNSVNLLQKAVEHWNEEAPNFVLQLGDIVEGNHVKKEDRDTTLATVLNVCNKVDCYVCHLWGNHEFYLFTRAELERTMLNSKVQIDSGKHNKGQDGGVSIANGLEKDTLLINNVEHIVDRSGNSGQKYYFSFSPHPKFKFVAIDSYDISMCGRLEGEYEYEQAKKILSLKNHNDNWNSPYGLKEPHFVKFNGGLSKEQLEWLDSELEAADRDHQNVIIISHIPVHPYSTLFLCNLWNYQDVLNVIWKHPCVKLSLCGHSHEPGDFVDQKGIQHIVFPAVLECNKHENAFADVYVYENKIKIDGFGKVRSYEIEI